MSNIKYIVTRGFGPGASGISFIVTRGFRAKKLAELTGRTVTGSMQAGATVTRSEHRGASVTASMSRGATVTGRERI